MRDSTNRDDSARIIDQIHDSVITNSDTQLWSTN